tara:strand:- start:3346 stop:3771 length:426 start_codon:yes stop_codon:yes gene_type:complete
MANLKQKFIKPGRDYNYSEGVKVLNGTGSDIAADTVLFVNGHDGPFLKVTPALGTAKGARGRLLIAKHAISAGGYGVGLPWKLVTGSIDMSGGGVGDQIFISDAGAAALSAGTKSRVIGHVVSATNPGVYLFCGKIGDQAA